MKVTMRVEGMRELQQGLLHLKKLGARQVVRATLKAAAAPILAAMLARVPIDEGDLRDAIAMRVRMRGGRRHSAHMQADIGVRKATSGDYDTTRSGRRAVGSAPAGYGWFQELGTSTASAQPFARPAWDKEGGNTALERIRKDLVRETERVAQRQARQAERLARKKG